MAFALQPTGSLPSVLSALEGLGRVRARNQALREQRRVDRGRMFGALGGAALGFAASGGNPAGAATGASIGGQLGGAARGGQVDPVSLGTSALQGIQVQQQQADSALSRDAAAEASARLEGTPEGSPIPGGEPIPGEPDIEGAFGALARDPRMTGTALAGMATLRGQQQRSEQAVANREFRAGEAEKGRSLRERLAERGFTEAKEIAKVERDFKSQLAQEERELKRNLTSEERDFKREQFAAEAALKKELQSLKVLNDKESPGQFITRMINKNIENPGSLTDAEREGFQAALREDPLRAARAARMGSLPSFQPGQGGSATTPAALPEGVTPESALADAKATIAANPDRRDEVIRRLKALGIDTSGL